MKTKKKNLINGAIALVVTLSFAASLVLPFVGVANRSNQNYNTYTGAETSLDLKNIENVSDLVKESLADASANTMNEEIKDAIDDDQPVWVIVKLDESSLLKDYLQTDQKKSLNEFVTTDANIEYQNDLINRQNLVYDKISNYCLTDVKYNYTTLLNGFSVAVRYGDVEAIENLASVSSVIISEKYFPQETSSVTENEVNVYDTGIYKADVSYDGTGTIVAILDTGLDYTHSAFQKLPVSDNVAYTYDEVAALVSQTSAAKLSSSKEKNSFTLTADDVYISKKVPYAYDYADKDANVYPVNDHGTHVAGIIAGSDDTITGVATEAQLAIMKVFGDKDAGAETADILSALQDCILLNVDVINMSLGTSCGFARDTDKDSVNEIYDGIMEAGISLIVAASNDHSAAFGSENGDTNLTSNPDSGTIGSPSTYQAAMSVASISGVKTPYFTLNGEAIYYTESSKTNGDQNKFMEQFLGNNSSLKCDYVVIPGTGVSSDYLDLNVENKIAIVKRGVTTFEEKILTAQSYGAIAIIIYNNQSGTISMSVGNKAVIPSCSITMDMGKLFEQNPTGTLSFDKTYLAGPFMSDFSSWGVMPDLELKPDITAHGGDILSAVRGGYDRLSGTSMACPNMAGATCLVRQYVKEMYPNLSNKEITDLSYQLMMSTATIALNEYGNPYSPRKQGAGIADMKKTTTTEAYLWVEGSNKTKLSLGDDAQRSGHYVMTFNITNMASRTQSYYVNPYVFTETVSSDGKTVAERAYMFNDYKYTVKATGATVSNNHVIVKGYDSATITVTVDLAENEKKYLDDNFINGMYVEGYITLVNDDSTLVDLNIPFCAFYGDWTEAPILDVTEYEIAASKADTAVLEKDKLKADAYGTLPMGGFYTTRDKDEKNVGYWGLGVYGYKLAEGYEQPQSMEEYAAITENSDGLFTLKSISAGLIRGAKTINYTIKNATTGEVIRTDVAENGRKSHYSGGRVGGYIEINLSAAEYGLKNNTKYTFEMECFLDWDGPQNNKKNTYSFDFYVDSESPVLDEAKTKVRIKEDSKHNKTYYLDMYVYDNHYLQCYSIASYDYINADGTYENKKGLVDNTIPVESARGVTNCITFDITNYWEDLQRDNKSIVVEYIDYARNSSKYSFKLPDTIAKEITFTEESHKIRVNEDYDLFKVITMDPVDSHKHLVSFTSSDNGIVKVQDGQIFGVAEGEAIITATTANGANASIKVVVSGTKKSTPTLEKIDLGKTSMKMNQGEEYTLTAKCEPWYFDSSNVVVTWKSTNPKIATVTVDPDNQYKVTIKALTSGSCSIVCQSGKYITSTLGITVKEEFTVESRMLKKYNGRGDENGVVTIPDDLGILYIYSYAFFDNDYIKKIIVPDGVKTIYEAAIYGCDNLEEVILPESCETIQKFGMAWNPKLKTVELGGTKTVQDLAFVNDSSLESINLSKVNNIGYAAFYNNAKLESIDLSVCGGLGELAFAYCSSLKTIKLTTKSSLQGLRAFYRCIALTDLSIPVNYVAEGTFAYCLGLTNVVFTEDVTTIDNDAFTGCQALKNVTYLKNVNTIGEGAFKLCTGLEAVVLPNGLTRIEDTAFAGDTQIKTVTVSKNCKLPTIGACIFAEASNLEEIKVEDGNIYMTSLDGVVYDKTMMELILVPQGYKTVNFVVPATVETIADSAFSYTNVESVDLNNVVNINSYAFYKCFKLATLTNYEGVQTIGAYAFSECKALEGIVLPVSLKSIGEYAFYNLDNDKIYSVVIPAAVETIGKAAFSKITGLKKVVYETGCKLTVVNDSMFAEAPALTEVSFSKGITTIGSSVFKNDTALTKVTYPVTVAKFGDSNYYGCTALTVSYLPQNLTSIPKYTFYGCTGITSFTVPKTVEIIGAYAFAKNDKLSAVNFNNVTKIDSHAFEGTAIINATLTNVTKLGANAFANATKLQRVVANKLETIGANAFSGTAINQVSFPLVTKVGDGAFKNCTALAAIELPEALSVGANAFEGAAVQTASLPKVKTIGKYAFKSSKLTSFTVSKTVEAIGIAAFELTQYMTGFTVEAGNTAYLTDDSQALYHHVNNNLLELVAYPSLRNKTTYTVLAKTVRIGEGAFEGNTKLTTVELPDTLKQIGDKAFYQSAIKTYKFNSYNAPELESTFIDTNKTAYMNFNFGITDNKTNLEIIVPSNGVGYTEHLYGEFFNVVTINDSLVAADDDCLNLKALLETLGTEVTDANKDKAELAVKLYGNLSKPMKALMTSDEMAKINAYKTALGL